MRRVPDPKSASTARGHALTTHGARGWWTCWLAPSARARHEAAERCGPPTAAYVASPARRGVHAESRERIPPPSVTVRLPRLATDALRTRVSADLLPELPATGSTSPNRLPPDQDLARDADVARADQAHICPVAQSRVHGDPSVVLAGKRKVTCTVAPAGTTFGVADPTSRNIPPSSSSATNSVAGSELLLSTVTVQLRAFGGTGPAAGGSGVRPRGRARGAGSGSGRLAANATATLRRS